MIHERALQAALTNEPIGEFLAAHLEECEGCRSELQALEALEGDLRRSMPQSVADAGWEGRVQRTLLDRRRARPQWMPLAASVLLASAMTFAWWLSAARLRNARAEVGARTPSVALANASAESPLGLWSTDYDDSTVALLQSAEPLAQDLPKTPPEGIENYLSPDESGGWNG